MKLIMISLSIFLPIVMFYTQKKLLIAHRLFTIVAIASALLFGNITALSIYEVLGDNTVFMTTIHGILLNPLFLISGGYLGIYGIYLLCLTLLKPLL
ncbi:MAG: transposase [Bacillus sp. (in: Bacteria)]|nr:transposase [Bacillus sp. (in: firmicutes)]